LTSLCGLDQHRGRTQGTPGGVMGYGGCDTVWSQRSGHTRRG
jgi:hypothetical protein